VQTLTRRKGELTMKQVRRDWPHHVMLSEDKVRGVENHTTVHKFANALSVAPLQDHIWRNDRLYFAFCFKTAEDAQTFAERFGGEMLAHKPR